MPTATFIWRIELKVPAGAVAAFEETLEFHCLAVSALMENADEEDGLWRIEGYTGAEPDKEAFAKRFAKTAERLGITPPKATFQLVAPRDWVAENLADFPPVRVKRYFIHGSHLPGTPPTGLIALKLDSGAAFGSGEHASTAGCLMVLDGLAKSRRFRNLLDMGCGSGILALAMAKTWGAPVMACDIDDEAVRVTRKNARNNGAGPLIKTTCAPGYHSPAVKRAGPYDLIVANILARPLCRMAGDAAGHLQKGGILVLSGLLERDGPRVIAAHQAFGLHLARRLTIDGWQTIVMRR
ncbi:MAG: 50S ribosomal protein L11 methyltransferase [Rhodospirillales bacterium]|nr:50S ribosomal protein L11 methyltransferase [Rhodospirillales bacterium]